jgi:hypothetical protein
MARIRSIKPEFWTDRKILALSNDAALFFIALWNATDDEGYFVLDTAELSARTSRWRPQEVFKHLRRLVEDGLVTVSSTGQAGFVTNWSRHQRVMKPQPSKFKSQDIRWDNVLSPRNPPGRIGRDRKGEDRIGREITGTSPTQPAATEQLPLIEPQAGASVPTWNSYREAYQNRYGVPPVRNGSVNSILANFVKRLGAEEAPLVAEFYLSHPEPFYVKNMHPVGLMLKDAEKLRTEWATKRKMTGSIARNSEAGEVAKDQIRRIMEGTL